MAHTDNEKSFANRLSVIKTLIAIKLLNQLYYKFSWWDLRVRPFIICKYFIILQSTSVLQRPYFWGSFRYELQNVPTSGTFRKWWLRRYNLVKLTNIHLLTLHRNILKLAVVFKEKRKRIRDKTAFSIYCNVKVNVSISVTLLVRKKIIIGFRWPIFYVCFAVTFINIGGEVKTWEAFEVTKRKNRFGQCLSLRKVIFF